MTNLPDESSRLEPNELLARVRGPTPSPRVRAFGNLSAMEP